MIPTKDLPKDTGERAQTEQIIRSLFRDTIIHRTRRGFRTGVDDLYWSVKYADRVPPGLEEKHSEIRLIRRYYDEVWFKELAAQELVKAAHEMGKNTSKWYCCY